MSAQQLSQKCHDRIKAPPNCDEIKKWVMCNAKNLVLNKGYQFSPAMKESWAKAKDQCKRQ